MRGTGLLTEDRRSKAFLDRRFNDSDGDWLKPLLDKGCNESSYIKRPVPFRGEITSGMRCLSASPAERHHPRES